MRKSDPWLEHYIFFVLDEILRLDDESIAWHFWRKAFFCSMFRRRRLEAWRAVHAALAWLLQVETGGQS